jgi:fatty acid desaturase
LLSESRNVEANWLERFLFAPHHTCLHLDHHLFPYVPWYRLPELHTRLRHSVRYRVDAHTNSGYFFGPSPVVFADMQSIVDDPRAILARFRTVSTHMPSRNA